MATREQLIEDFADHKYATGEKFARLINSMKVVQEPVETPAASGTSLSFIDSIEQDKDGKITATKKTLDLANAHEINPFKGWWKTGDTLPTSGFDGAYLYFKDTTQTPAVTTIYQWNGTTYAGTGTVVDESNVQTFGSGQPVNTVGIEDEPTADSENLVKSRGVYNYLPKSEIKVNNPSYTEGVMHIDGTVDSSSTQYGYTDAILLEKGASLILNQGSPFYHGGQTACVFKCDSSGVFESTLVSTPYYQTIVTKYTNTFDEDIYIGISGYKTQLNYSIIKLTEAASKNDFDDIKNALNGKVDYFTEDVTNTENIIENKWIKYENGVAQTASASGQWSIRYYPCKNIEKLYCKVGSDGSLPVSIAFYTQRPLLNGSDTDTGYYLKDVSVQAQQGVREHLVDIPGGASWAVISNKGATFDSPIVKLYSNKSIETYDSELLYQSSYTASSSSISSSFNVSGVENGTQLELEVTEVAGNSELSIVLLTGNQIIYEKHNVLSGKYYFEKTPGLTGIRLSKVGAEGNLFNWKLKTLTKHYPIQNRAFAPFLPTKQVETINLGTPFNGYYGIGANQDSENTIVSAGYWVSWPLQKTNGFTVRIEFDASQYVVNFSSFDETYQRRAEISCNTSPFVIDLSSCRGWNLAIRKTNYSAITPADVENAITVTKVSGTIYEKPLLKYEVEKIVDKEIQDKVGDISTIEANARKALTLSEEGYGFNPFIKRPFYYHFAANGFLRVKEILNEEPWIVYRNAVASQSLDDVEIAARLGFGLIEANIQPTSDGHFVVIHGTGGAFGPECKSINTDVISTANLQSTAISSVSLDWIKTNVRYDSYYEKYQTTLPSLEEFCESCKKHNIGIFAGTNSKAAVDICVKYLGQNVVVYNPPANIRSYFNGWCFIWNNTTTTTVEQILTACRQMGAPVMYGLGPGLANKLYADDNMNILIDSMHKEGFLVGWTANYDSEVNGRKYHKLGMDFSSSEHDINPFEANYEVFDIDSDNPPTTTGSISNGIISLTNGQTITCGNASKIIGKAWLSVRFNGTLTFSFGSKGNTDRTITSDGSEDIVITDYFFMRDSTLYVNAHADTTVTKFLYKTSKC